MLSGFVDHARSSQAAMELMTLDATGDQPVTLQLECPDGELEGALSLMDVVDLMGVTVNVRASGLVGGPPVGVLAVCHHRTATVHARFRLSEPRDTFRGPSRELFHWAEHRQERWRAFCERLARGVRPSFEAVEADLSLGRFLGADEALAYGLIDEVLAPQASSEGAPPRPIGFQPPR
jgi:ATP-dependent Clp protease protease subunit